MPAPKQSRPPNAAKGSRMIEPIEAPCADCMRETFHDILHTTKVNKVDYTEIFDTIQCRGCSRVSLRETTVIGDEIALYSKRSLIRLMGLEAFRTNAVAGVIRVLLNKGLLREISPEEVSSANFGNATPEKEGLALDAQRLIEEAMQAAIGNPSGRLKENTFIEFHPPPTSRRPPDWGFPGGIWLFEEEGFLEIFEEIYVATRNRLPHLAIMGIRAVLEQVMIKNNRKDYQSFQSNLREFEKRGFIASVQRESLEAILNVGHAVIHRSFKVSQHDLDTALDIMEGILAAIYHHREPAKELLARVPPRGRS
jgi:hypothetical protein